MQTDKQTRYVDRAPFKQSEYYMPRPLRGVAGNHNAATLTNFTCSDVILLKCSNYIIIINIRNEY